MLDLILTALKALLVWLGIRKDRDETKDKLHKTEMEKHIAEVSRDTITKYVKDKEKLQVVEKELADEDIDISEEMKQLEITGKVRIDV